VDIEGRTALFWSVVAGQEDSVKLLLKAGGDSSTRSTDRRGRTPHHVAAAYGQVNVLGALLGASTKEICLPDLDGFTPLHYAAFFGHEGTLEMLLQTETGAVADPKVNSFSPWHCAIMSGSEQCLQLLVGHSTAGVNTADATGATPLHIAASKNLLNSVKLLLSNGAEVNAKDIKNRTPIMMAASAGHVSIIEHLLDENADAECTDADGNTALHMACGKGMSKSANLFLKNASPEFVSQQNCQGKSALHLAAGQGLVETTELLLGAGASVTCVDSVGNPPALDCASNEDTATCLAMILSVYLTTPTSETRKSLRSIGSLRRSEVISRLSSSLRDLDDSKFEESPFRSNGSGHNSLCSSDSESPQIINSSEKVLTIY